jgi:hypothetical protein
MPSMASAIVVPSSEVGGVGDADPREEDRLVEVDREVQDDERQRAEDGQAEQRRHLLLRATGRSLVEVSGSVRRGRAARGW